LRINGHFSTKKKKDDLRHLLGWMKKGQVWYNSFWLSGQQRICLPHLNPASPRSLGMCCSELLLTELQDVKMEKRFPF